MRSVFQINTVYQLFITINLRLHNLPDGEVDLIVSDHTPVLKEYMENLAESRLFGCIFYLPTLEFNNYFWGVPNDQKSEVFSQPGDRFQSILSHSGINYNKYDRLYTANLDAFIKVVHSKFPALEICQIEDGAATCSTDWKCITEKWNYIEGFNKIYDDVKEIYLCSPELMSVETNARLLQLPSIERSQNVKNVFNQIFNYTPIKFPRFVFIEQSFQVDGIVNNDLEFMQVTSDMVGYENLYIKTHPRNKINRPFSYGIGRCNEVQVPFEVMLLNAVNSESVFITVDSGSLISSRVIFNDDIKSIFLYKAIKGKTHTHGSEAFEQYMDKFCDIFAGGNMMIPKSMEEYKCTLKHLLK